MGDIHAYYPTKVQLHIANVGHESGGRYHWKYTLLLMEKRSKALELVGYEFCIFFSAALSQQNIQPEESNFFTASKCLFYTSKACVDKIASRLPPVVYFSTK